MAATTQLGTQGFQVSKLGFGCMGLSGAYNDPLPEQHGISVIHYAFTQEKIQLATKFGVSRRDASGMSIRGSPDYVCSCCEASLKRLGVEYIDLYYQHRVDKSVLIEDTVGELKKVVEEGKMHIPVMFGLYGCCKF